MRSFQPGDILACYGTDPVARTIEVMTSWPLGPRGLRWPPSHVGLIVPYKGDMLLVESTTLCRYPCAITGHQVSGVQAHLPTERILDYLDAGGHVDIYRLTPQFALLPEESNLLAHLLIECFLRRAHAYDTLGAVLSGTRIYQLLGKLFPATDTSTLFCSELVASVLMRLGRLSISNPARYNPGRLLRELVWSGVYQRASTIRSRCHEEHFLQILPG